jgi:2-amino-4-hydroxy-6-hydroxymethyldihydropteridine diphosphokinase
MEKVFLSLGSNLGDRLDYLKKGIEELSKDVLIKIDVISSVYETEPVGYANQPCFLNVIVEIETGHNPEKLLLVCKNIENKLGRITRGRWMEREIDIDIIFFGNQIIEIDNLVIPHRELYNRKFVLEPLNEIAPMFQCPITLLSVKKLLSSCGDNTKIKNIFKFIPGVT